MFAMDVISYIANHTYHWTIPMLSFASEPPCLVGIKLTSRLIWDYSFKHPSTQTTTKSRRKRPHSMFLWGAWLYSGERLFQDFTSIYFRLIIPSSPFNPFMPSTLICFLHGHWKRLVSPLRLSTTAFPSPPLPTYHQPAPSLGPTARHDRKTKPAVENASTTRIILKDSFVLFAPFQVSFPLAR